MGERASAVLLIALVGAAGCGGNKVSGRAIFARSCSHCHSLDGRGNGAVGGELGYRTLSVAEIASFARIMPVTPPLTDPQVRAVAEYVRSRAVAASRRRRRRS
jgi:mono/diheme cytochrome c family protein